MALAEEIETKGKTYSEAGMRLVGLIADITGENNLSIKVQAREELATMLNLHLSMCDLFLLEIRALSDKVDALQNG